jgi:hypothetical protein
MNTPLVRLLAATLVAVVLLTLPLGCDRSSDLRQRTSQLMAEIETVPTDADNYTDRLVLLEEWWNDLSERGRLRLHQFPAGPLIMSRFAQGFTDETPAQLEQAARMLAFVEQHGDQVGRLARVDSTDLVVNTYSTIVLEYTVGEVEIATGGALRVGQNFFANYLQKLQNTNPEADAYVTFEVTGEATTEPTSVPWLGIFNDLWVPSPAPALRVVNGKLRTGDTVRITLGDRSGGSRGLRMMPHDTDEFRFVLEFDPTGGGVYVLADFVALEVRGDEPAGLRAVAPSVVATGEPFALRLAVEDRYFSPATFGGGSFTVLLDGEPVGDVEIAAGDSEGRLDGLIINREGGFRFEVRSTDGAMTTFSNPVLVETEPRQRIFWGELHGHTGLEDAIGSAPRYYRYAREVAFLDFGSLSGHDIALTTAAWNTIRRETAGANRPGEFVAFMGYEWTVLAQSGGHHNVFFRNDPGRYATFRQAPVLPELYEKLREIEAPDDVLVIPHAHEPGDWNVSDPDLERLVEVYSMHGSFEYFGQRYLDRGFRLGLIAASDDHSGHPGNSPAMISNRGGLAAVYAPRLDRDEIWEGLRSRATYGTSGKRPVVVFTVEGSNPGGVLPVGSIPTLEARVLGTAPIDHIDVIRNGAVEFSRDYLWPEEGQGGAVQIMFHSPSETPGDEVMRPLTLVTWHGDIQVTNARIASVTPIGIDHFTDVFRQLDDHRIAFDVRSRGDFDGVLLELDDAASDAAVTIRITRPLERMRDRSDLGRVRTPGAAPPEGSAVHEVSFRPRELNRTKARFELSPDGVVLVRRIRPTGDWDVAFDYRPGEPPQPDDYFYLRVVQIDGEVAWTSPIWIGGE